MDSFEFESGRVLENVNVEYSVSGIPKYDDDGNMVNVVIYCPTLKGDYSILPKYHDFISNGIPSVPISFRPVDKNKWVSKNDFLVC